MKDQFNDFRIPVRKQITFFVHMCMISLFQCASLPRIFRLFRALGLRHVVVINYRNEVCDSKITFKNF